MPDDIRTRDARDDGAAMTPQAIAQATAPLDRATHTPGAIYGSQEVFDLEKERMFMRDWLFVGRVEELSKPGDFLTHNVMGEPIVVTRDTKGGLNAFYNQCLHRGVEIAWGEKGNTRSFVCPYHAWTYDLQGNLRGTSYMEQTADFDRTNCRLRPLRIGTWGGGIFVCFDPEAPPLETYLEFYAGEFDFLRQQDLVLAYKLTLDFPCNWKFVYENLLDIYHIGTTHASTIARFHDEDSYRMKGGPDGALSISYETQTMTPDGKTRFGKIPWLTDETERFARIGFLPPNMTLLARFDFVRPIVHWPITPSSARSVAYYLFPREAVEDPAFDTKIRDYIDYGRKVLSEDTEMVASLQRAVVSRGFVPGRMSTMEHSVHHVIGHHLRRLYGEG